MHEFDEGLDSFRSRSVLQKSWTNSVISTPTGRFASSGMALSTTIWRFAGPGMAFSATIWRFAGPETAFLSALAGLAGPGTAFWAPRQVLLALERRFESHRSQKEFLRFFHDLKPRPEIYG